MYKIYKIINLVNGMEYIGQTTQDIRRRFSQHMTTQSYCTKLKEAVKEFGKENFAPVYLTEVETRTEAKAIEHQYITEKNTIYPNGYNLMSSGFCSKHSGITKQKMSATRKGKHPQWATEASRSEESRKKRAEALRGQERSKEAIEKMKRAADSKCKPIKDQNGKVYRSAKDAAEEFNISRGNIQMVLRGKRKSAGGLKFEYID